MAEIPEGYQANQQVTPGPLVNAAPIAASYAKIASDVEQTTRPIAQAFADQNATQSAQDNPYQQEVAPIGQAAQTFNQSLLAANKGAVNADMIQKMGKMYTDAFYNNGQGVTAQSIAGFQQQSPAYFKGLMSTLPAGNRAWAKDEFTTQATQYESKLQASYNKKLNATATLQQLGNINTIYANGTALLEQGNYREGYAKISQGNQLTNNAVSLQRMTPFQGSQMIQNTMGAAYTSQYRGQIMAIYNNPDLTEGEKETQSFDVVRKMSNDPNSLHALNTNLKLQRAVNNLKSFITLQKAGLTVQKQNTASQYKALTDQAYHIGTTSPALYNSVTAKMTAPQQASFDQEINMNAVTGQQVTAARNGSVQDAQTISDNIGNSITQMNAGKSGWNDPIFAEKKLKVLARAQKDMKQVIIQKQHAFDLLPTNPAYQQQIKNISANPQKYSDVPAAKTDAALNLERQQGYTDAQLAVMPSSQAKNLYKQWASLQPSQQAAFVQNQIVPLVGNNKQHVNLALQQMYSDTKHANTNPLVAWNVLQDPRTQEHSDDVNQAFGQSTKEWLKNVPADSAGKAITASSISANVISEANPVLNIMRSQAATSQNGKDAISSINNYISSAIQLAAYYHATNRANPDQAAADVVFNDHYQTDSLNGSPYTIPYSDNAGNAVDKSSVHALLQYQLHKGVGQGLQVPTTFDPQFSDVPKKREELYANSLMASHQVVNVPNGYMFRDNTGQIVRTSDGKPIQTELSQLVNPTPEVQHALYGQYHNWFTKTAFGNPTYQNLKSYFKNFSIPGSKNTATATVKALTGEDPNA